MGADKESRNENHNTPLNLASRKGHFEIVNYLVEKGANFDSPLRAFKKQLFPLHTELLPVFREVELPSNLLINLYLDFLNTDWT
jgi:ankyrin repeat protein